jgi:hypothetical protein
MLEGGEFAPHFDRVSCIHGLVVRGSQIRPRVSTVRINKLVNGYRLGQGWV